MIDEIIDAVENYLHYQKAYKEAKKECLYDAAYFLQREIEEAEKSKKELEKVLNNYIDKRISEYVNSRD